MPNPADFCTVAWAAEQLDLSQRHVRRLAKEGKLQLLKPLTGSREEGRRHNVLLTAQVREFARARKVISGDS